MHLLYSQSLNLGQPIGIPELPEDFYALDTTEKFITFQPFSKPSKSYSYWNEVLSFLLPVLNNLNIRLIQIGAANEPGFAGCVHLQGKTSLAQTNYLIKRAALHFGADSFGMHCAGIFNTPCLGLYSNNYVANVQPFFGDKSKQIFLDCLKDNEKPSFSYEEQPKKIDRIKPEVIFNSICKLLNLDIRSTLNTLYFGYLFLLPVLESLADQVYDPKVFGVEALTLRLDKNFNPDILIHQIQVCPINIVTNKEIDINLLRSIAPRIQQIFYILEKDNSPGFVKALQNSGIKFQLISMMSEEEVNEIKLNYCDYGIINRRRVLDPQDLAELKDIDKKELLFKTNKYIIFNKILYPSFGHLNQKLGITNPNERIYPIIDSPEFWLDWEHYYFLKNN